MIKYLDGTKEIVAFEDDSNILCFDNTDYEEYPVHWHTPVEIIMPLEGTYDIECGQCKYHLRENDILIISPGTLHYLKASHGRRIIFQAGMTLLAPFTEFESFFSIIQPALMITPEEFPEIHSEVAELLNEIKDEYFGTSTSKIAAVFSNLLKILVLVSRNFALKPGRFTDNKPTKQTEYVEKFMGVCEYINNHCTEDLSLDEVADMAGFSKYHFSRLFKEFANVSFYKYLNNRRITYSERLLLDPNINVMEAASRSGFNSISAFMRMFKQIKGCTPTEFRNLYWHRK